MGGEEWSYGRNTLAVGDEQHALVARELTGDAVLEQRRGRHRKQLHTHKVAEGTRDRVDRLLQHRVTHAVHAQRCALEEQTREHVGALGGKTERRKHLLQVTTKKQRHLHVVNTDEAVLRE